jgi:hypothetical protein
VDLSSNENGRQQEMATSLEVKKHASTDTWEGKVEIKAYEKKKLILIDKSKKGKRVSNSLNW